MITPIKYMDLDFSLVRIASLMIKQFEKNKILGYSELLDYLADKTGEDVKHVFVPALDFLFLLGRIDYHLETDSIEYVCQDGK